MKWPWISRERYDEAQAMIAALQKERCMLLNRIAAMSGLPPLYQDREQGLGIGDQENQLQPVSPAPKLEEKQTPPRLQRTFEEIETMANQAAANGELGIRVH